MAIIPASLYPGQVVTPGGSYPLGKARNEVVEGDGSGTPLEELWVNDLWGFLQALLAGASITASGAPDQVGASQYLAAIQALIDKFAEHEHFWTSSQEFGANLAMTGGQLTLNADYEQLSYITKPTRKVLVPLVPQSANSWVAATSPPQWASSNGNTLTFLVGRDLVPSGAIIQNIRACVNTSVNVTLNARQITYDTTGANAGVAGTVYTDSFSTGSLAAHVLAANIPADTIFQQNATSQLQISIAPAASGCALRWIEIEYLDQQISNY